MNEKLSTPKNARDFVAKEQATPLQDSRVPLITIYDGPSKPVRDIFKVIQKRSLSVSNSRSNPKRQFNYST